MHPYTISFNPQNNSLEVGGNINFHFIVEETQGVGREQCPTGSPPWLSCQLMGRSGKPPLHSGPQFSLLLNGDKNACLI